MKYLIAGLGNPGEEYGLTRHNIGFLVCDFLCESSGVNFTKDRYGSMAVIKVKNKQAILLKPDTFMNLSGKAIRYWMDKEKIPLENILVVTDDLALPLGKLRLKGKGSDGGHNGLKNIFEILQTEKYARLRFGISDNFSKGKQIDYVLGNWGKEEWIIVQEKIKLASEICKSFMLQGCDATMSSYNNN